MIIVELSGKAILSGVDQFFQCSETYNAEQCFKTLPTVDNFDEIRADLSVYLMKQDGSVTNKLVYSIES